MCLLDFRDREWYAKYDMINTIPPIIVTTVAVIHIPGFDKNPANAYSEAPITDMINPMSQRYLSMRIK